MYTCGTFAKVRRVEGGGGKSEEEWSDFRSLNRGL